MRSDPDFEKFQIVQETCSQSLSMLTIGKLIVSPSTPPSRIVHVQSPKVSRSGYILG